MDFVEPQYVVSEYGFVFCVEGIPFLWKENPPKGESFTLSAEGSSHQRTCDMLR